jgi:hypothetical protein
MFSNRNLAISVKLASSLLLQNNNKIKTKQNYHTKRTVRNSNRKIVERAQINTLANLYITVPVSGLL